MELYLLLGYVLFWTVIMMLLNPDDNIASKLLFRVMGAWAGALVSGYALLQIFG